jgi:hypothetical protein
MPFKKIREVMSRPSYKRLEESSDEENVPPPPSYRSKLHVRRQDKRKAPPIPANAPPPVVQRRKYKRKVPPTPLVTIPPTPQLIDIPTDTVQPPNGYWSWIPDPWTGYRQAGVVAPNLNDKQCCFSSSESLSETTTSSDSE